MAGLVAYNFTVDDASPIFTYSPYADFGSASGRGDGLHNGWQTWYSGSGYLSSFDGPSPLGESFHLTSLSGASVSLTFYGTGVSLYGLTNCSYDVIFDGSLFPNTTPVQGVFFSTSNESPGTHNVSLIARPDDNSQVLSFNRAIVTSVANSTTPSSTTVTIDNQNTSAMTYTGDWTPSESVSNIPSSSSPAPFHRTTASGASASFDFTGRAVALYGPSTANHGSYSVTLDGVQRVFNGSSQWLLGKMLMFYQDGLDENATHSLNLTNLGDGDALSLSSVQITQFSSADSASTDVTHGASRVGAIVGPVVAFVVLSALAGLYFWTRRWDKRHPKKRERSSSITSSIFLPPSMRRKYDRRGDEIIPYALDFRSSFYNGTRGSVVSSNASTLCEEYPQRIDSSRGEKDGPADPLVSTRDTPVAHSGPRRPANDPPTLTYPPAVAQPPIMGDSTEASVMRADGSSLVGRLLRLTARNIDARPSSTTTGSAWVNSVVRPPPYPESV